MNWQPSAALSALRVRADLLAALRDLFRLRNVLEVETPLLASAPVTDPNIDAYSLAQAPLYLQTSPEYAMKRLLAAGSGPIFQVCKAFRRSEQGSRHNPEFSMLEWYRPDFTLEQLMDEVAELLVQVLGDRHAAEARGERLFPQTLGRYVAIHRSDDRMDVHVDYAAHEPPFNGEIGTRSLCRGV